MLMRTLFTWHILLVSCVTVGLAEDSQQLRMSAVERPEGITILDGIRPVLTYQRATQSRDGKWPRANYVHPLYNLDGEMITEDFPVDHGHHRGVFWAWHQVLVGDKSLGDAWICDDFEWEVQTANAKATEAHATITATTRWKSPALAGADGQPIACVREQTTIVVHAADAEVRWIDFNIELLALLEEVRIGGSDDDKGYGGFSPRFKLTDDVQFIGTAGPIEPQVTAIHAGPWVDVTNQQAGVVILTHASNPGFPQPWILRRSRSMQNVAYPGRHPIPLSQTEPLQLRYRLGIHRSPLEPSQIDTYQQQYQRDSSAVER